MNHYLLFSGLHHLMFPHFPWLHLFASYWVSLSLSRSLFIVAIQKPCPDVRSHHCCSVVPPHISWLIFPRFLSCRTSCHCVVTLIANWNCCKRGSFRDLRAIPLCGFLLVFTGRIFFYISCWHCCTFFDSCGTCLPSLRDSWWQDLHSRYSWYSWFWAIFPSMTSFFCIWKHISSFPQTHA